MSFGQILRDLLSPLGVYRWEGAYQWAELQCEGMALDGVADELARIRREMNLATAQEEGLAGIQALLGVDPGPGTPKNFARPWPPFCASAGTASPWRP